MEAIPESSFPICALDGGGLGARLESVGEATLAAVLTILVECHLYWALVRVNRNTRKQ
jgi:hypothetical protein